jgi:hypothetical protein
MVDRAVSASTAHDPSVAVGVPTACSASSSRDSVACLVHSPPDKSLIFVQLQIAVSILSKKCLITYRPTHPFHFRELGQPHNAPSMIHGV